MRRSAGCLGGLLFALLAAAGAWADAEVVVASERVGDWRVTLLAAPWPLRAGPVEFSVLLQDARSGRPVPEAEIALEVRSPGAQLASAMPAHFPALRGGGGNPLFYSARLELTQPGRWWLRVRVVEPALSPLSGVAVEVAPAASLFVRHGIALSLPILGVALLWLHEKLRRRMRAGVVSRNPGHAE